MLRIVRDGGGAPPRTKKDVLVDQIIDATTVAGISFFTDLATRPITIESFYRAGLAFGLVFCIKLKEYRKIS